LEEESEPELEEESEPELKEEQKQEKKISDTESIETKDIIVKTVSELPDDGIELLEENAGEGYETLSKEDKETADFEYKEEIAGEKVNKVNRKPKSYMKIKGEEI
jgi:hypothetical protein